MKLEDDKFAVAENIQEIVNAMIASELNGLTSTERATILNDLHGVGDSAPEERNSCLIDMKLREMDFALRSIPVETVFEEAQRLCHGKANCYVNDPAFRIRFLRAARYNVDDAVTRMIGNLKAIRDICGQEGLTRPIHLSDMMLEKGSGIFLYSGNCFQVMPFRDRLGRRIIVRSGKQVFDKSALFDADFQTRMKCLLFVCQELSDDVECQLKGVVIIGFPLEVSTTPAINGVASGIYKYISEYAFPVRVVAVHLCILDNKWFRIGSALLLRAFPKQFRLRSRIHIGSIDECCYKLMAYGIPGDQIPIKSSGIIKISDHKRFLAYCQEREDAVFRNRTEFKGIFCPSSKDILVGRGPRIKNHVGNEMYRLLLQNKFEEYNSASIARKREIALEVIQEVHCYGGRFLIPAKNCWMEAHNETARSKVSIAFRDVRKTLNSRKNRTFTNSVSELSARKDTGFGCL